MNRLSRLISKVSNNPGWAKVCGSLFGFIEVPLLEGVQVIDKYLVKGFYEKFMKYFALFYGSRVIPLNVNIDKSLKVSPTEEILEIIKRMPSVSIGFCYCRVSKRKNNPEVSSCTHRIWTCIHIGTAKKLDEINEKIPLKKVNYEEVKAVLQAADRAGLVHQLITVPTSEYFYVICNCCSCCCIMLNDVIQHSSKVGIASNFIATNDASNCVNCGKCVERCYFDARRMINDTMHFQPENCVGCGLCITICEYRAITLSKRIGF
ncbi:MAG: 4Fe-4S binding protein [Candidatus Heimdallarchaeota archaeon]|nr:MAG: 4Fe-4S binding protein [Candidatus Heimdallarchaeota archaeon]